MAILGNNATPIDPAYDSNGPGIIAVCKSGTAETGTITDYSFWGRQTGAGGNNWQYRGVVYADNAGVPGTLLWVGPEGTVTVGDNWFTNSSLSVAFTAPIWIGMWWGSVAPAEAFYGYVASGDGYYWTVTYNSTTSPGNYSSGTHFTTENYAVYVTYTAGGPPPPTNTVAPSITGTAQVGQTLTCNPGTWTG